METGVSKTSPSQPNTRISHSSRGSIRLWQCVLFVTSHINCAYFEGTDPDFPAVVEVDEWCSNDRDLWCLYIACQCHLLQKRIPIYRILIPVFDFFHEGEHPLRSTGKYNVYSLSNVTINAYVTIRGNSITSISKSNEHFSFKPYPNEIQSWA